MIGNPMPENRVIHGFNVERVGTVAAVWHSAQTSIVLILTKIAASNFDMISALDFYLYPQSVIPTVEDILLLFYAVKDICPELCYIVNLGIQ